MSCFEIQQRDSVFVMLWGYESGFLFHGTGCDSGFGYTLAKKLDTIGMTVFAGCLDKDSRGATNLQFSSSER